MGNLHSNLCVNLNRRDHLGVPGMGSRLTPNKLSIMMRAGFDWLRMRISGGFSKPRVTIRVPYKGGNFLLN